LRKKYGINTLTSLTVKGRKVNEPNTEQMAKNEFGHPFLFYSFGSDRLQPGSEEGASLEEGGELFLSE
jgi:hypothetical protein